MLVTFPSLFLTCNEKNINMCFPLGQMYDAFFFSSLYLDDCDCMEIKITADEVDI